jgi:magnesium transporter
MDLQFKISKDFIEEIQEFVSNDDRGAILNAISTLHEADIAEILDVVSMEEAKYIFRLLEDENASDVLVELEEDVRVKFLDALSAKEIAEQMDNMDSDDAADIMAEMSEEKQEEVISQIEDPQQAIDIAALMQYDEDTVFNEANVTLYLAELEEYISLFITYLAYKQENPDAPISSLSLD